jgi:hypothetical protein
VVLVSNVHDRGHVVEGYTMTDDEIKQLADLSLKTKAFSDHGCCLGGSTVDKVGGLSQRRDVQHRW